VRNSESVTRITNTETWWQKELGHCESKANRNHNALPGKKQKQKNDANAIEKFKPAGLARSPLRRKNIVHASKRSLD